MEKTFFPDNTDNFLPVKENFANLTAQVGDDTAIVTKMIALFSGGNARYMTDRQPNLLAFLKDPNNASGIIASYNKYGDPTGKDYPTQMKFYYAAQYMNQYPLPAANPINCNQIATMQIALNSEIANSDKLYVNDGDATLHLVRTTILNDMLSVLSSMYANLSCDAAIQQQQQDAIAAQTAQEQAASQQALLQTYQATSATATGGGTSIAVYAVGGVAAIIVLLIVIRLIKK